MPQSVPNPRTSDDALLPPHTPGRRQGRAADARSSPPPVLVQQPTREEPRGREERSFLLLLRPAVRNTVEEAGPKSRHTGLKVSETRNRANPPSHLRFKSPRGDPPPHCPAPHPDPAPHADPARQQRLRTAPGARRPATAGLARLGREPGGNGSARRPAPWEGPARRAAAAHLRTRPGPERGGTGKERLSRSPRGDGVRHRPQPLVPERVFKPPRPHAAASPSAARKSGPLPRRAAIT